MQKNRFNYLRLNDGIVGNYRTFRDNDYTVADRIVFTVVVRFILFVDQLYIIADITIHIQDRIADNAVISYAQIWMPAIPVGIAVINRFIKCIAHNDRPLHKSTLFHVGPNADY